MYDNFDPVSLPTVKEVLQFVSDHSVYLSQLAQEGNPLAQATMMLTLELVNSNGGNLHLPGMTYATRDDFNNLEDCVQRAATIEGAGVLITPDKKSIRFLATDKKAFSEKDLCIALRAHSVEIVTLLSTDSLSNVEGMVIIVPSLLVNDDSENTNPIATFLVGESTGRTHTPIRGNAVVCKRERVHGAAH